jgi:hypothetical protein
VVRYCSARFIILSGRNPPAGKTEGRSIRANVGVEFTGA